MEDGFEILDTIEAVYKAAQQGEKIHNIAEEFQLELDHFVEEFDISPVQAVILSAFVHLTLNRNAIISLNNLASFFDLSITKMARFMPEINDMKKSFIISESHSPQGRHKSHFLYKLKSIILEAVVNQDLSLLRESLNFDFIGLFDYIESLLDQKRAHELSEEEFKVRINELFHENAELPIVKRISEYKLDETNRLILIMIIGLHIEGEVEVDLTQLYRSAIDNRHEVFSLVREMQNGKSPLIKKNIVSIKPGMFASREVSLTEETAEILFSENTIQVFKKVQQTKGMPYKSIKAKELFYSNKLGEEIKSINHLLGKNQFEKAVKLMKENNMSLGVNILLYGPPGTGKTEMVYQLARQTKRNIMPVVISDTKSKWFGESEKLIKKVFDDYRKMFKEEEMAPILFFNEADAIFGNRNGAQNTSADQTRNAIQNILLQELEDFQGILIATTNMTDNLDSAFDRRFLFKVKVDMPDYESRLKIWKSKMPKIKLAYLKEIAGRYEVSGGQIDNVVRRVLLDEILGKTISSFENIDGYVKKELSLKNNSAIRSIGFTNRKVV